MLREKKREYEQKMEMLTKQLKHFDHQMKKLTMEIEVSKIKI